MAKRYELPDAAWDLVADLFTEARRSGRPRADDRLMLNGVLGVLCSGAAWRDMPERSSLIRRRKKRGPEEPQDHALGRSRGGLTTKIHMLCDANANGVPLRFLLSGGQASDIAYAQPLLDEAYIASLRGRHRKRCRWLLADKGYDAQALRRYCDRYRMQPVIPLRDMKRKPKPGLARLFDRPKYRQRNIIERMLGWLKKNRRTVTRFDKLATSFAAMVSLACSMRCLRQYFSYRA